MQASSLYNISQKVNAVVVELARRFAEAILIWSRNSDTHNPIEYFTQLPHDIETTLYVRTF